MASELPTITYAKTELNGITVRPSSSDIIRKAVQGHSVEVLSGNDYINLYHVFDRMQQKDKRLRGLTLVRKQIGHSRWLIVVTHDRSAAPGVDLLPGYDPKRGRYKRYAAQLANGETVTLSNKQEAVKARRAWQLYVPAAKRRHLRSTINAARGGKFSVMLLQRKK